MKVLVTGGGGFVGSHVCEYYAKQGCSVVALDNLSRSQLLHKKSPYSTYNWNYLGKFPNIKRVKGSILRPAIIRDLARNVDAIIHTAGQTAVTASVENPVEDFQANAFGTLNILEAARLSKKQPTVVLCSTNKVYGENVNQIPIKESKTRYIFKQKNFRGIPENLGVDLCEHTPYGCSKLASDLYAQDYARLYGLKVGVFRMSCIYGTRQFGVEDQGWLAWFVIAAITGKPITIYGNGKQVRDVLWVEDLVRVYDKFLTSSHKHVVVNTGGGAKNTLSILELLSIIRSAGYSIKPRFSSWRPSDQKIYISDTSKAVKLLEWTPRTSPAEGVEKLIRWAAEIYST